MLDIAMDNNILSRDIPDLHSYIRWNSISKYVDDLPSTLDIGCNIGTMTIEMAKRNSGKVIGIDVDPSVLAKARERAMYFGLSNCEFMPGSAVKLPFAERTFDQVLLADVLEHVDDDVAVIRECFRVMKPGGRLIINAPRPNYSSLFNKVWIKSIGHVRDGYELDDIGRITKNLFEIVDHDFNSRSKEELDSFYNRGLQELTDDRIKKILEEENNSSKEPYGITMVLSRKENVEIIGKKIRVLHVSWGHPPNMAAGPIYYLHNLCAIQRADGIDVACFVADDDPSKSGVVPLLSSDVIDGIQYFKVGNRPAHYFDWSNVRRETENKDIEVLFDAVLEKWRPDVVHFHNLIGLSMSLPTIAKEFKASTVLSAHNYWMICSRDDLFTTNELVCPGPKDGAGCAMCVGNPNAVSDFIYRTSRSKEVLRKSVDLVLAVSERVRQIFIDYGVPAEKIVTQHIGSVAAQKNWEAVGQANKERLTANDPLRFAYFGTFSARKGVHLILEAAKYLKEYDGKFVIELYGGTGDDGYKTRLETIHASDPFLQRGVIFKGGYLQSDQPRFMRDIDAVIVSPTWEDNGPQTVMESLGAGIPVIGAKIGGIPDFVIDGKNGLLFYAGDASDLASALRKILDDKSLLNKFREAIRPPLTMDEHSKELAEQYLRLPQPTRDGRTGIHSSYPKKIALDNLTRSAEEMITQKNYDKAEGILNRVLFFDPKCIEALNDFGVLKMLTGKTDEAMTAFKRIMEIDPDNKLARENMALLRSAWNQASSTGEKPTLTIPAKTLVDDFKVFNLDSLDNYRKFISQNHLLTQLSEDYAKIKMQDGTSLHVEGYCWICKRPSRFLVDTLYAVSKDSQGATPNWRERLVCASCGNNARLRAFVHFAEEIFDLSKESSIYITEQVTPLYNYFISNYPGTIGSEYLGVEIRHGHTDKRGIRNEDLTHLTFADNQFDYAFSLEVLEHIPDVAAALREVLRVLKPTGRFALTVPFLIDSDKTVVRATLENGVVKHILPPEYHGDPVRDKGCLCYRHFGWDLLEEMKRLGFGDATAFLVGSENYGYSGLQHLILVGQKEGRIGRIERHPAFKSARAIKLQVREEETSHFSVDSLYEASQEFISSGDYNEAANKLEEILVQEPGNTRALNDLAVVHSIRGDMDSAIAILTRLVEVNPDNSIALKNLGNLFVKVKRFDEGLKVYLKVLRFAPRDIELLMIVGNLCVIMGLTENAAKLFKSVLELDPTNKSALEGLKFLNPSEASRSTITRAEQLESQKLVKEHIPCHFCGSWQSIPFRKSEDIVKCTQCGTVYLRTTLAEKSMMDAYQSYADDGSHLSLPKNIEEARKSGLRRDYFMDEIQSMVRKGGTFLDVGCAWGAFLDNARDRGFVPRGIEVTHKMAEYASTALGLDVVSSQFVETPFAINSISVISIIHVFEHLPDPKKALRKAFEILEPGGMFAGIVPNIESLCSAVLEDTWNWLQPMYHYVHYSPATLRKHLEDTGFKVEKLYTTAGEYDRDGLATTVRETFNPKTDEEYHDILRVIEERGFGEEIRFFARKPLMDSISGEETKDAVSKKQMNHEPESKDYSTMEEDNFVLNADRLYERSQELISSGKYGEAAVKLEKILSADPQNTKALNDLAVMRSISGQVEESITLLRQLVRLEPSNIIAQKNLAKLYLQSNKIEEALKSYTDVLKTAPNDTEVLLSIGKICAAVGRIGDAKFFFNKILALKPDLQLEKIVRSELAGIDFSLEQEGLDEPPSEIQVTASTQQLKTISSNPLVSIILLVYNKLEYSKKCLESIFANVKYKNFEIIVLDNASTDGTCEYMTDLAKQISNVKYIRKDTNLGYVGGNNNAVAAANGDYIIFLNNDTEVKEGWMESLVEFAVKTQDCGAVGSKLVYPDGRLQEAGGITFSDANGWNYGRGDDPNHPKFNFVREVDYISGASLMVKRDIWDKIGGFDMRYAPAYYEDADLCFAIRNMGYKVFYQPKSSLVHHEGITSGTNLNEGFKKFQVINRPKFIEKWKEKLVDQLPNDPRNVEKASDRGTIGSILVCDPTLPWYDRAAGSLHLFNILKVLKGMKYHVTFIAGSGSMREQYEPILQEMGVETYSGDPVAMFRFGRRTGAPLIDYARMFQERKFDYAIIDFWYHAEYYLPLIRQFSPQTKIIIDTEDVHFVREMREAEIKNDPAMIGQARNNKKRELAIYRQSDTLWVVTEEDRKALISENVDVPIEIRPVIHQLPIVKNRYDSREGILFVGNFNHRPNLDGIQYFVKEVWPEVARSLHGVKLYIVGNDPQNLAGTLASENVLVIGYVEDISAYYSKCRLSVAPLRYGAGLKGKVVESLSYGVPVVTTSIGAEGTGLVKGSEIIVADQPQEMARKIVEAYSKKDVWEKLSVNGRSAMERNWSFESGKKTLQRLLYLSSEEDGKEKKKIISIVILTYNQLEYTKITIDSIRRHTKAHYELIVVDNASTDGTVEYLKSQKDIRAIFNQKNLGFPSGCNQGMEIAKGDFVVLLNNDVIVPDNWLEGIIECAESMTSIGIVGPMSNRISGFQLETNISYRRPNQVHEFAAKYRRKNRKRWLESPRVAGFCMLIKREVMDRIGGLDVAYGIGNCEDDDYCVRAQLAGFKVAIAGDVFIHHFGSKSFGKDGLEKYREVINGNEKVFKEKWGVTPLEWWREGKSLAKTSPLYLPFNVVDVVLTEG